MLLDIIEAFNLGKSATETAIVDSLPSLFSMTFAMISNGDINQITAALLTLLGITILLARGFWKMVVKVYSRKLFN